MHALQVFFIVPVSIIMHNFWDLPEGTGAQQVEFVNFFKVCGCAPSSAPA